MSPLGQSEDSRGLHGDLRGSLRSGVRHARELTLGARQSPQWEDFCGQRQRSGGKPVLGGLDDVPARWGRHGPSPAGSGRERAATTSHSAPPHPGTNSPLSPGPSAQLVPVRPPSSWGQACDKSPAVATAVIRGERERERGWGSPPVPDILFRMPIKDNVTCKTCKLLPSLWRPPGPTPHSLPSSTVLPPKPRAPPWGLRSSKHQPLPSPSPLHPLSWPSGQQGGCARPGGGNVLGQVPALALAGESPRGSVLMNPRPGSLFSAPGNSHTGRRHPGEMGVRGLGSNSNFTTIWLLKAT